MLCVQPFEVRRIGIRQTLNKSASVQGAARLI
jgi:hypothetical protein